MMIAGVAPEVFCLIFLALVIVVFLCCFWLHWERRRALQAHQDSLSESDLKGGDLDRSRLKRIKIKKDSKKKKDKKIKGIPREKTQENPQREEGNKKEKNRLYLLLTEFADLDLSDDELSEELLSVKLSFLLCFFCFPKKVGDLVKFLSYEFFQLYSPLLGGSRIVSACGLFQLPGVALGWSAETQASGLRPLN